MKIFKGGFTSRFVHRETLDFLKFVSLVLTLTTVFAGVQCADNGRGRTRVRVSSGNRAAMNTDTLNLDNLPLGSSSLVPGPTSDFCYSFKLQDQINIPKVSFFDWENNFDNTPFLIYQTVNGPPKIVGWYVLDNVTQEQWVESQIMACQVDGTVSDLKELKHNDFYYAFGSVNSDGGRPVKTVGTPFDPSPQNFELNKEEDHKSLGAVFRLERNDSINSIIGQFVVQQLVYGDKFGPMEVFDLILAPNVTRQAVLFTVQNLQPAPGKTEGLIYSFQPSDSREKNEEFIRFFQEIPLTQLPMSSSLRIGTTTFLILATPSALDIWVHPMGDEDFVRQETLVQSNIVSIDSVIATGDIGYLAAASSDGQIQIYKWSMESEFFMPDDTIAVRDPLAIRLVRQLQNDQIFLVALTSSRRSNVHVFAKQISEEWLTIANFTSQGTDLLEAVSFAYDGRIRTQIFLPNARHGVNVVELQVLQKSANVTC